MWIEQGAKVLFTQVFPEVVMRWQQHAPACLAHGGELCHFGDAGAGQGADNALAKIVVEEELAQRGLLLLWLWLLWLWLWLLWLWLLWLLWLSTCCDFLAFRSSLDSGS